MKFWLVFFTHLATICVNIAQGAPQTIITTIVATTTVSGGSILWGDPTPLTKYAQPDATIIPASSPDSSNAKIGNILIDDLRDVPKLQNATIDSSKSIWKPKDKNGEFYVKGYSTGIWLAAENRFLGLLLVDTPVPDPKGRFENLASDPLLSGVPSAIQSLVNPSSVIPPPTKGCETAGCVVVFPVSFVQKIRRIFSHNISRRMCSISVQSRQTHNVSPQSQGRLCLSLRPS